MKVYVVMRVYFSEQVIEAVFSTEELAKDWIDKNKPDYLAHHRFEIEDWEVIGSEDVHFATTHLSSLVSYGNEGGPNANAILTETEKTMNEQIEDEKRVWYLKGYEQAERDCEALIKKLVKDISYLSAERLALIDDIGMLDNIQTENVTKLELLIDLMIKLLTEAYGVIDSDYDGTEEHQVLRKAIKAVLDSAKEE